MINTSVPKSTTASYPVSHASGKFIESSDVQWRYLYKCYRHLFCFQISGLIFFVINQLLLAQLPAVTFTSCF